MTNLWRVAIVSLLAVIGIPCGAAAQLGTLDLAEEGRTVSVEAGRAPVVTIINRIPERSYRYTVLLESQPVPPIGLPDIASAVKSMGILFSISDVCKGKEQIVSDWAASLEAASNEGVVATLVGQASEIRRQLEETSKPCADALNPLIQDALDATVAVLDLTMYVVNRGEQLTLTITRSDPAPAESWTYVLVAPRAGQWMTTWGFTFAQDRDDRFFLEPGEEADTFVVTRERSQDEWDLKFVPSVFFHWLPGADENRDWSWSPFTAGLGVSKEAPAVMIGTSITRRQNLSLIFGGMLSRALRLDGVYHEGKVLKENVPTDQLHESTYRAGVFLSLAIRFDRNPFGGDDAPEIPEEGTKEPTEEQKKVATEEAAKKKAAEEATKKEKYGRKGNRMHGPVTAEIHQPPGNALGHALAPPRICLTTRGRTRSSSQPPK